MNNKEILNFFPQSVFKYKVNNFKEYNKKLSEKRALAVFQKLVANGVSEKRLAYKGFGEQFPKNNNVTELDRELNRRTEFYIIKK